MIWAKICVLPAYVGTSITNISGDSSLCPLSPHLCMFLFKASQHPRTCVHFCMKSWRCPNILLKFDYITRVSSVVKSTILVWLELRQKPFNKCQIPCGFVCQCYLVSKTRWLHIKCVIVEYSTEICHNVLMVTYIWIWWAILDII